MEKLRMRKIKKVKNKGITDILLQSDFTNLYMKDLDHIIEILHIDMPQDINKIEYLFAQKKLIFDNEEARNILVNKALSGQCTVKFYNIYFEDDNKDAILDKLKSKDFSYNEIKDIQYNVITKITIHSCITLLQNKYLIRIIVPNGVKNTLGGSINDVKNIIVIIDLDKKFVEIRANSIISKKIAEYIKDSLKLDNIDGIRILNRYTDIENLKNALGGKFTSASSKPKADINLTKNTSISLANILVAMDDYFVNKEIGRLTEVLEELDIDNEGATFTQLLLAGADSIGIKITEDSQSDLSDQTLYSIFKKYMIANRGYISFSLADDEEDKYTIRLGLSEKVNTITFVTSATEDVIDYVRNVIV